MAQQEKDEIEDLTPTIEPKKEEPKAEELVNPFLINPRIHGGTDIQFKNVKTTIADSGGTVVTAELAGDRIHLTPQANPPPDPVEGDIYADTDHHAYYYYGSGWRRIDYIG